jgi:S1-C subfamily serine protease
VYDHILRSTVWIVAGKSTGTGWVVDRERGLVVTNQHLVGSFPKTLVIFPAFDGKKRVIAERDYYFAKAPRVGALVLETSSRRDLALLQLPSLPPGVTALKLADDSAKPGEMIHSVGNPGSSGALWVYTSGTVRQVYTKKIRYKTGQLVDARMLETQAPINPGDSGGPVVNSRGQLVGVVAGFAPEARLVSSCIDVTEVRDFLKAASPKSSP